MTTSIIKIEYLFFLLSLLIACWYTTGIKNAELMLSSFILFVGGEGYKISLNFNSNQFEYDDTYYEDEVFLLGYTIYTKTNIQDVVKTSSNMTIINQELYIKTIAKKGLSIKYKVNLNKYVKYSEMFLVPVLERGIDVPVNIDNNRHEISFKLKTEIENQFKIGRYEVIWKLWKIVYDLAKNYASNNHGLQLVKAVKWICIV